MNIDEMIKAAQANASQVVETPAPANANLPATQTAPTNGAVANYSPPGAALTLEDLAAGSLSVDGFLKLSYFGITIGDNPTLFDQLEVSFRPDEVVPHKSLRMTVGTKTTYFRSLDGQRELRTGESWADTKAKVMKADPRCTGDYDAADIPFTLRQDLKDKDGKVILEAGKRVGYTTSVTGMKPFRDLTKRLLLKVPRDAMLVGVVKNSPQARDSNKWGFLVFGEPTDWQIVLADEAAAA